MTLSSEPVYLASIGFTQNPDLYALCLKTSSKPDKVFPLLCPRDIAGMVLVAQKGQLPANVIYRVLNNVLCRDDHYIGGVELLFDPNDSTRPVAQIQRQHGFSQEALAINASEGVIFAYINDYPLLSSGELMDLCFVPVDKFFTDRVSSEEFKNDILLNRRT
jgi:hypothetical protein